MTEKQFQEARKIMQTANCYRGYITKAKAKVARWGNLEDAARRSLQPNRAEACKKMTLDAIEKLNNLRQKFADLKFPE